MQRIFEFILGVIDTIGGGGGDGFAVYIWRVATHAARDTTRDCNDKITSGTTPRTRLF